ncbi:MAG: bifunctional ornithine acetyltransferase/N-acetylglutamate synthase, partial [Pararoseburia sp.]|nr:bifunctional ornithine acetyltransferase/N-acetylglutamate synthase [Pararoseburia sp.]
EATNILTSDAVTAICVMHQGSGEATAWGCDLTHEYVTINADYRS